MNAKTLLLIIFEPVIGLLLVPYIGIYGFLIGLLLIPVTLIVSRRKPTPLQGQYGVAPTPPIIIPQQPMRLRTFLGLIMIVALIAILFSPSALKVPTGGGSTQLLADSFKQIQPYLQDLKSKYHVIIANDTETLQGYLNYTNGKTAYFLIGPDFGYNLTKSEADLVRSHYINGTLSMLISDGNYTNDSWLKTLFDVQVKGDAIVDNTSPFPDQEVFNTTATIARVATPFVIDIGSPIIFGNHTTMQPIASSSGNSVDVSLDPRVKTNATLGPRQVAASAVHNGNRALLIADSGPFSTVYDHNWTALTPNVNETAFTWALTTWVTNSDSNTTIIVDNVHYRLTQPVGGLPPDVILPVGRVFALFLSAYLSFSNSFYSGFIDATRAFILGIALITAWFLYGILTSKYAKEPRGKDDLPHLNIEKQFRAESRDRKEYLPKFRDMSFYASNISNLYNVLDTLMVREFGARIKDLKLEQLTSRFGEEQGGQASRLLNRLAKISQYANGQRRILFPPVLRWKHTTRVLDRRTETLLNQLGATMIGNPQKRQLDYKLRRG